MKTLILKSGVKVEIPICVANVISNMLQLPYKDDQCFVGNDFLLTIKLSEVACIN